MTQEELRRLARLGAEARLQELQRELTAIYSAFPDLRSGAGAATRQPARRPEAAQASKSRSGARRMSAAGRQRIADAAKRRWAEWRAQQAKPEGETDAAAKPAAAGGAQKKR
jgi:hypothetical protein